MSVGARVQILDDRATVRYIGRLQNYSGVWIGVEWDDSTRGKHDGSVNGLQYFRCQHPTGGSFVRKEKVHFGVSVVEALRLRYFNVVGEGNVDVGEEGMYVQTVSHRLLKVDLEGKAKVQQHQQQLHLLTAARLRGLGVAEAGDPNVLSALAPNLVCLDLTGNLLSSWSAVQDIVLQLPRLQELRVSDNHLLLPSIQPDEDSLLAEPAGSAAQLTDKPSESVAKSATESADRPAESIAGSVAELADKPAESVNESTDKPAESATQLAPVESAGLACLGACAGLGVGGFQPLPLTCLVMNQCKLQWPQVVCLLQYLPNLEGLHLTGNNISSLTPPPGLSSLSHLAKLKVLDLEDNQLSSWDDVLYLAGLPLLSHLYLGNNPLDNVRYSAGPCECSSPFASLQALYMGGCQLSSWGSVDEMNKFSKLAALRLTSNPLLEEYKGGGRFEVIARIGGLTMLNGSSVRWSERRDAELQYLQMVMPGLESAPAGASGATTREQLLQAHPRLKLLQEKYGAVTFAGPQPSSATTTLKASTLQLKLTVLREEGQSAAKSVTKKLPRSLTLANLKLLGEKLLKVKVEWQQLFLKNPGEQVATHMGEDDSQQLADFDVKDGAEVVVGEVDPDQRKKELAVGREAAKRLHEERMVQMMQRIQVLQAAAMN